MVNRVMLEANLHRTENELAQANANLAAEESKDLELRNQAAMELAAERQQLETELAMLKQAANEALEKEREVRIQHTQEVALRRCLKQSMARGWTTWLDFHHKRRMHQRMARLVVLKLHNLRLHSGFVMWLGVWETGRLIEAAKKAEEVRWTARLIKEEHQLSESEAQRASVNESLAMEREKRIQLAETVALRHARKQELQRVFAAWREQHRALETRPTASPSQTHLVVHHSDAAAEGSRWEQFKDAIAAAKEEAARARQDASVEARRSTAALEKAARALLSASKVEAEAKTLAEQVEADKAKLDQVMRHMAMVDLRKQATAASSSTPQAPARRVLNPTPPKHPRNVSATMSTPPPRPRRQSLGLPMSSPKAHVDRATSPELKVPRSPDYLETLVMMQTQTGVRPGVEGEPSPKNVGLHRI